MQRLIRSRRWTIATFSIACLTYIAIVKGIDTSMAISGIAIAMVAGNSFEKVKKGESSESNPQ